ncbi:hypothetical protein [Zooshikella harenae]|uniref:DUF4476 domain-containing protein n=1 Tax=Zooshikella harenae TaxID=2827238 RepID=A0ABS5ZCX1_9GAMM|nr:hypothetical protein [Zooshikella harenae]MBU2710787.1 hypothetical protein [Zooshikella harenae]
MGFILHCYALSAKAGACPGSDLHKAGIEPFLQVNAYIFCGKGTEVSSKEYRGSNYDVIDIQSKKKVLSFSKQQTTHITLNDEQLRVETFFPLPTDENWGLKQYPHYRYTFENNKFKKSYIFQMPTIPKESLQAAIDMTKEVDKRADRVQQLSSVLLLAALNKSTEAEEALLSLNKKINMDVYHLAVHKQNVDFLKEYNSEKHTDAK